MVSFFSIIVQFVAGTLAAIVLSVVLSSLNRGLTGSFALGGLGGVMIAGLREHVTGGHHLMTTAQMAQMIPASPAEPATLFLNIIWGGGGGLLLMLLAFTVCSLVGGGSGQ